MIWHEIPVKRPVATSMFFCALLLLGLVGLLRIPVELIPNLEGSSVSISFSRINSDPETVEREILIPLEGKASELPGLKETFGTVNGSGGSLRLIFEPGTDIRIRELELQRIAAELQKEQPRGSAVYVTASSQGLSMLNRFVMSIQILGLEDTESLKSFIDERIEPRIAAVGGVGSVMVMGGASEEITVMIDPDKCSALGLTAQHVAQALSRSVQRLKYLGGLEDHLSRKPIMLDGRPKGPVELGEVRITPDRPILIRHVAEVSRGTGLKENLFRINSKPAVGLTIVKDEEANLVKLGRDLRGRIEELREEFSQYGIDFKIGFDGAEEVENQINRLKKLAVSGYIISLVVLFLFIRRPGALAVVAIAVPVSLLASMAFLYTGGYTINIISLIGLAVGVGMLVDNSIVVYEAIQRRLERGMHPDAAASAGVTATFKAILASTITTAVVFLPIPFLIPDATIRGTINLLAASILIPLGSSLIVAVGLVPLLSRNFTAPSAVKKLIKDKKRKELYAGLPSPDTWRNLFSGLLKNALRRPASWIAAIAAVVVVTVVVGGGWVIANNMSREPGTADQVRLTIDVPSGQSLESLGRSFYSLEQAALKIDGVESVESDIREEECMLTVKFVDEDVRPEELSASMVRNKIRRAAQRIPGLSAREQNSPGRVRGGQGSVSMAGLMGQRTEIIISGPDSSRLMSLAETLKERLETVPEIIDDSIVISSRPGQDEIHIIPDSKMLKSLGLMQDEMFYMLSLLLSRDGTQLGAGTIETSGKEIPIIIRSLKNKTDNLSERMESLRISTSAGVIPLGLVADARKMPPPSVIEHHNGRRELGVSYSLKHDAPTTGPEGEALQKKILSAIKSVHLSEGYIIDPPDNNETVNFFKSLGIPIFLLLFAVLAFTFESYTMPVLVLFSAPLTMIGAIWGLNIAGLPLGGLALPGAVVLMGLMVNPAILLVERMQQKVLSGRWTAGAAAVAAVRERSRPVLMTACTTIAGLWPLAISTGAENEMWPSFAVVVMGGLVTSSILILQVIPIGFVFLNKIDRIFGRLGPWITVWWIGATALVMAPLIYFEQITTMRWQVTTTLLVASLFLGLFVWIFRRPEIPEPSSDMNVEVKFLHKVYGRPGPIGRAWRSGQNFAERVLSRGGAPFIPEDAVSPIITALVLLAGSAFLTFSLKTLLWRVIFSFVCAVLIVRILILIRKLRGFYDEFGRVKPGGTENLLAFFVPWIVLGLNGMFYCIAPMSVGKQVHMTWFSIMVISLVIIFVQAGRKTAKDLSEGKITDKPGIGSFHRIKSLWRKLAKILFGLDLPRDEHEALKNINFKAESGMIGILGPNGAGKTTLLRSLAGILEPSAGVITIGGVPLKKIRKYLANWVGYLPQDFGLPNSLTGREYLEYYALLYRIDEKDKITERVNMLLEEVGLSEQADKKIGSYSGGMKQRAAVARTLLRLPSVIIVDEPTVGLDPKERIRFRNLLTRLSKTRIVLFSTHVVEDVAVACERVIVLSRGVKVFDGEPRKLANEAEGKVWDIKVREGGEADLPDDCIVVDHIPEEAGWYRIRALCSEQPAPEAQVIRPNLQDGYLELVGTRTKRRI